MVTEFPRLRAPGRQVRQFKVSYHAHCSLFLYRLVIHVHMSTNWLIVWLWWQSNIAMTIVIQPTSVITTHACTSWIKTTNLWSTNLFLKIFKTIDSLLLVVNDPRDKMSKQNMFLLRLSRSWTCSTPHFAVYRPITFGMFLNYWQLYNNFLCPMARFQATFKYHRQYLGTRMSSVIIITSVTESNFIDIIS